MKTLFLNELQHTLLKESLEDRALKCETIVADLNEKEHVRENAK